ncbi:cyclopropane fatty acyl phospholipid synthase [Candidatus Woesearchaeota archaeon]|nr:cyclopropane fatty acyl phospholipid synthase [Candidatus Woesearchaeota archaeon]
MKSAEKIAGEILKTADIRINGNRRWDIQVHNHELYARVLSGGSLALGESYMDGWWDCAAIDEFSTRLLQAKIGKEIISPALLFHILKAKALNQQRKSKAFEVGQRHYDVGNDLYKIMLDKRMIYTSGYWKKTSSLDKAQEEKLELVCKKIDLKKGMSLLDIGCGWGGFAKYAAEKYGARVVGITIAKEQAALARESCKGLPVEIRLQDYRDLKPTQQFDRVVSIGMIEHVGPKNYPLYFKIMKDCLKDDGLLLVESFSADWGPSQSDPWSDKYIFPNGTIPRLGQIVDATEKLLVIEDCHNFGADYDKTLMAWHKNVIKHKDQIKQEYGERFLRMWNYYLLTFAGMFRSRKVQNWHIVFSKSGMKNGYVSIR